jgi:hypothetical protein
MTEGSPTLELLEMKVLKESHDYASFNEKYPKGSQRYVDRYNGYHAGYMDNAAEVSSLTAKLEFVNKRSYGPCKVDREIIKEVYSDDSDLLGEDVDGEDLLG